MIVLQKIFRQCRLALLIFLLTLPVSSVWAAPEMMPVEDVKQGMQGIGKTVVSGTKLEEFGVEVLGVMKNKGPSGDLILVRTFGDVIDRTGGIAQGMSGSPVYINNKLVGAIAYGWSLTDHKIGMVTPIADMLKLWEMPDKYNASMQVEDNLPGFEEMATPLMVSGFSSNALSMLQDKLKPFNLSPYEVGVAPSDAGFGPLEPGGAVGVELVRGDSSVAALGTVTYVEGDKVLAFGHPFLKKGNIGYFMTNAYVFTTVMGLENSFKVGTTGDAVGLINQDRGAAVAGKLGRYPTIIPVRIMVKDNDTGKISDSAIQVIKDEQLSSILTATTVFNVIDKTIDRVGPGTAKVSFEISGRNMPVEVIRRENMFYSPASVGESAVGEFLDAMTMISGNQYNPVDIMDVKVNVSVSEERRTATIVEAKAKTLTAKPGETIDIGVKIKPFRGEPIARIVPFTVPKEQPEGPLTLEVRGGGMVPIMQLLSKQQGLDEGLLLLAKPKQKNQGFSDVIKEFVERDRNNEIVVEVFNTGIENLMGGSKVSKNNVDNKSPESSLDEQTAHLKLDAKNSGNKEMKNQNKSKNRIATDYIIDGDTQILVTVVKDKLNN
ncbi:SpoIVB peptidase S55 domain-containing protein [Pelosinus sp. UFO1]|uniref:SpoIVB peptidase S55 domain-containing protein n=1 Tax=Pelosinus sp. UFO1 TaxID=484770 RepID=UPI0004D0C69D|nr:SpoIVB peptidase S55 domain-containing protein [Pelosinus sp. UFO1]AIF53786.1 peptidase S55 SpoIVB [Pelosinus sp. UFO1]